MSACPWQWRLSSDSVALSGEPFDEKGVDFLGAGFGLEGIDEVVGDVFGSGEFVEEKFGPVGRGAPLFEQAPGAAVVHGGVVFGEDETEALDFQRIVVLGDIESEAEGFAQGAGGEAGVGVGRAGEVFADAWVPPERR